MIVIEAYKEGPEQGVPQRVIWIAAERDPDKTSARMVAHERLKTGRAPHVIYHPGTGNLIRMVQPENQATALRGLEGLQILVVAQSDQPFTSGPLRGLESLLALSDDLGIPRLWPAGPPPPDGLQPHTVRTGSTPGHYAASQLSENPSPGAIDIARIQGA